MSLNKSWFFFNTVTGPHSKTVLEKLKLKSTKTPWLGSARPNDASKIFPKRSFRMQNFRTDDQKGYGTQS